LTVALGLVCADGVIVASDSMASDGSTARSTTKVNVICGASAIWTSSGSVYVIEEVTAVLEKEAGKQNSPLNASLRSGRQDHIREVLGKLVRDAMKECYGAALPLGSNQMYNVPGAQAPKHQFATSFLFLGWTGNEPWFLEIADDGQLNWHTGAAFYAIGVGGPFATVAQGLMRHYWATPRPVEDGRLVAYRTIASTIDVSTGLVGYPVCLAEATSEATRIFDPTEIERDIKTSVERWTQLEAESLARLREGNLAEPEIDEIPEFDDASEQSSSDEPPNT
jgi:hypothetical protein